MRTVSKTVRTRFTRADYERLPEGFPAQLVEGTLVRDPAPTYGHQRLVATIYRRLGAILGWKRVVIAPIDVGVDEYNVYQPDVVVVRREPSRDVHDVGVPLVAVEVTSSSTARRDRGVKRRRLLAAGAEEVWVVDPAAGSVERYDADGCAVATGTDVLRSRAVVGFEVVPARLFADA